MVARGAASPRASLWYPYLLIPGPGADETPYCLQVDITAVEPIQGRTLLLTFANGERRVIDIAAHFKFFGVFEPLNDDAFFRGVRVNPDAGTIQWPNGADMCPDVLYNSSTAARTSAA